MKDEEPKAFKLVKTRMHSGRMRTGRSLTVCCSLLCVCVWGGVWSQGLSAPRGSGLGGGGRSGPGGGLVWGCVSASGGGGGSGLGGWYPSMH